MIWNVSHADHRYCKVKNSRVLFSERSENFLFKSCMRLIDWSPFRQHFYSVNYPQWYAFHRLMEAGGCGLHESESFTVVFGSGKLWIKQLLLSAFLLPVCVCGMAFLINFIAIYYHASRAIPFTIMVCWHTWTELGGLPLPDLTRYTIVCCTPLSFSPSRLTVACPILVSFDNEFAVFSAKKQGERDRYTTEAYCFGVISQLN